MFSRATPPQRLHARDYVYIHVGAWAGVVGCADELVPCWQMSTFPVASSCLRPTALLWGV